MESNIGKLKAIPIDILVSTFEYLTKNELVLLCRSNHYIKSICERYFKKQIEERKYSIREQKMKDFFKILLVLSYYEFEIVIKRLDTLETIEFEYERNQYQLDIQEIYIKREGHQKKTVNVRYDNGRMEVYTLETKYYEFQNEIIDMWMNSDCIIYIFIKPSIDGIKFMKKTFSYFDYPHELNTPIVENGKRIGIGIKIKSTDELFKKYFLHVFRKITPQLFITDLPLPNHDEDEYDEMFGNY